MKDLKFNDTLKIAQIVESTIPINVLKILSGREDYIDATDNNDKLYGTEALENAIIECDAGVELHSKEDLEYLEAIDNKMAEDEISYIQLIK